MPTIRPGGAERFDRARDRLERVGVEGAEALVEEDRVELRATRRRELGQLIAERECERQRRLERLAARKRAHRSGLVGVAMIDDDEFVLRARPQ